MIDSALEQLRHALDEEPPDPLARRRVALGETQTDVVHLHDQCDDAVDDRRDHECDDDENDRSLHDRLVEHLLQGDHHDLGREDEVGSNGAGDGLGLGLGPQHHGRQLLVVAVLVMTEPVVDLLGTLEAEVRAAEHQDDLHEHRRDGAQDQGRGKDEQDLVAQRSRGDLADDRQLALGGEAANVCRRHGGVVDDDARRLHARAARRCAHVVHRRRGQLGERRDIIE